MPTRSNDFAHFRPVWISAPLLRLLIPLIAGITLGWYLQPSGAWAGTATCIFWVAAIGFSFTKKPLFAPFFGACLQFAIVCMGMCLVFINDKSKSTDFIGKKYVDNAVCVATLQEPLNEKAKSYKAEASIEILTGNKLEKVKGNIIVYFQKDSTEPLPALGYGSRVLFRKTLQPIRNAGNPGGFDYQRYSAFHNLYFQIFLKDGEYETGHQKLINPFWRDLFALRDWSLAVFKKYISSGTEAGMAEALLIGYRNDLDREIVQQYTNTGVVHIIAISGMHLGLIYGLVLLLFKPFANRKKTKIIKAMLVIAVLWGFSLLTGAAPSITRSAIMFTFLVLGEIGDKKTGIYNSLACAAFLLLLYDPFTLWDVGFQLSFSALLSIAVFAGPIERLLFFGRKWQQKIWQLNAVTISAQLLTFPVVLFHFHQFPNLFLLTNLIAVPLSSIIIYMLIALLALSWVPFLNIWLGISCKWLIWAMDKFIELVNGVPYALTDNVYFTFPQSAVIIFIISAFSFWWLNRSKPAFVAAVFGVFIFMILENIQFLQTEKQKQLIVYNVPQHAAVDVINGRNYTFYGDSVLLEDGFLQNFHLKPSRVEHQIVRENSLPGIIESGQGLQFGNKKMVWVTGGFDTNSKTPVKIDVAVITGNPKLKLNELLNSISPAAIVADGTNSRYKIAQWQKQADSLHLRFHSVADQGAFVMEWQ